MNAGEYLNDFQKYLKLGGGARTGVVTELASHLEEYGTDQAVEKRMGDPGSLARAYNLSFLGRWQGVSWMFLTPALGWALLVLIWARFHNGPTDADAMVTPFVRWWYDWGRAALATIALLSLSAMVVSALARLFRPWRTYVALLVLTLAIGMAFFGSIEYTSRSGMVDLSRVEFNFQPGETPQFRDKVTGLRIADSDLKNYTTHENIFVAIVPALLMSLIIVGVFTGLTLPYMLMVQRRMGLIRKQRTT